MTEITEKEIEELKEFIAEIEKREPQPELTGFWKFIQTERFKNMMIGIFNVLLLLGTFFLGFDAANWTNKQVQQYCVQYCILSHNTGNNTVPIGNYSFNITNDSNRSSFPPYKTFDDINISGWNDNSGDYKNLSQIS